MAAGSAAGGEGEVEYGPTAAGHGAAAGAEGTGLGIRVTLRLDAPSTSTQNDGVARRGATAAVQRASMDNVSAPSTTCARESATANVSDKHC